MAFSACLGRHLFFCIFLSGISDPWAHRPGWNSPGKRISSSRSSFAGIWSRLMVCSNPSLAFERPPYAHRLVLGRHDCVIAADRERMAARNAGDLFRLLPFFCEHRAGFLQLPVGRDAARSGIHRPLLCSARIPPWLGSDVTAIARQSISAAMGMVPHLLRIRCGKDYRRRSRMAPLHRHG